MGNIHINQSLDPDRRIFQYLSFYELVDLLKFNQTFFMRADYPQRQDLFSKDVVPDFETNRITLQSWSLAADDVLTEWEAQHSLHPGVCIVSSIRALSQSLFTDDATRIYIELAHPAMRTQDAFWCTSLRRRRTKALPRTQSDALHAIAISKRSHAPANLSPAGMHLLVDLRTLLAEVVIPPRAPARFMELVTKLVQESTWITVTRASSTLAAGVVSRLPKLNKTNTGP